MTSESINLPAARSWRDIPQPVLPRGMSREGRWRFTKTVLRAATVAAICGALAWVVWVVVVSLQEDPRLRPTVAQATPMKPPELRTDGVLDDAWLVRSLGLPRRTTLMELDLEKLRARLLADDQVVNATLTRHFPDRLVVQITERSPVARVMTEWKGQQRMLLVARDGVAFDGTGYDRAVLDTLPWLDGVDLKPDGAHLRPIDGMDEVADLLAKARLEAEHLYATWHVVSLARLQLDHQIDVRTTTGLTVVFNTRDDFFRQLAKLDYITDQLTRVQAVSARIDLSLGRDVPVSVTTNPATATPDGSSQRTERRDAPVVKPPEFGRSSTRPEEAFFTFPNPQPKKINREL